MGKTSRHLKAAILEVVDNQIRDNDPPETRETFNRLVAEEVDEADARLYIAQAVAVEIWDILKNKKQFNRERYVRNLEKLPSEPSA